MHKESKQSGAKGISLFNKRIELSVMKLTVIYTVILAFILLISSGVTYSIFSSRINTRFERFRAPIIVNGQEVLPPRAQDVREDLINSLILVNTQLLILAAILSYFLARMTLKPIDEAYEQQRRFLGDASHELRTPLAILQAELENELHGVPSHDTPTKRIESHLEEVERMTTLVNDLLTLSHLDEQDQTIEQPKTVVNITTLLEKTVERLKPLADKNNISVHLDIPKEQSLEIRTNERLLMHAIVNIIKNAIAYNNPNGSVHISTEIVQDKLNIKIKDTGVGIAEADLEMIFDRFYRVHKSRSRQSGGSGLGLSIVRSAIAYLHGTVHIDSVLGNGTSVTVTLPIS